ncbi:MAG: ABC transporter permease, partial [Steroidobacteraceae bacterium]|nr:ABC transporter permease [Steroidobacteraceae bacterium]
ANAEHVPDTASCTEGNRFLAILYGVQESLRSALISIRAHRLRSFLTMLGVIIGVSSVILVVALMQGLSQSVTEQLDALGSTTLTLRSYTPREDQLRGKRNRLTPSDLEQLEARIDGITNITPLVYAGQRFGAEVRYGSERANGQFLGTTASFQDVNRIFPLYGRFVTQSDEESRRRVVVLGEQIRKDLKLPENPVGRFVQIGDEWFKVVGLMEPRGEIFGQSQDAYLVMPYSTALAITGSAAQPDVWVSFSVIDPDRVENVKEQVAALMRRLHGIEPDEEDDFVLESSETIAATVRNVSLAITLVVAGIVGISLVVGGVGIMNIMLVSVTERTREIGIAKALGAPRRFILLQFLIEAMVLAALGGLIGIGIGMGLAFGAFGLISSSMPAFPAPYVPWWAVLGAFGFSALVGMTFGILPASKAANLAPIDALRYE